MQTDGSGCVRTAYTPVGTQPSDSVPVDPSTQSIEGAHSNIFAEYPPCPLQPVQPGQPSQATGTPVETRAMTAARIWERIPLSRPQPTIAPGRAISGKRVYLETNNSTTFTYSEDTPLGPIQIVARGSYFIDWGDGESSGPFQYEGIPWPSGQITHEYLNVGRYNIVVTERWVADWRSGAETGVLRTLRTIGRIDNFPVEQLQAVIGP
jgi:hypothetical protein